MNEHEVAIMRMELVTDPKQLCQKAKKVSKWSGQRIGHRLTKFVHWKELSCVGLAAPQVGILSRVFVLHDQKDFAIFVNPRIVEMGAMETEEIEGCLSIPGRLFKVKRSSTIIVKDAHRIKPFELDGWSARAYLHELDHLNGKLISDIGEEVPLETNTTPFTL